MMGKFKVAKMKYTEGQPLETQNSTTEWVNFLGASCSDDVILFADLEESVTTMIYFSLDEAKALRAKLTKSIRETEKKKKVHGHFSLRESTI